MNQNTCKQDAADIAIKHCKNQISMISEAIHLRQISDLQLSNSDVTKEKGDSTPGESNSVSDQVFEKYQKCLEELCDKDNEIRKLKEANRLFNKNVQKMKKFMKLCKEENEIYTVLNEDLLKQNDVLKAQQKTLKEELEQKLQENE